jgi:hypothetical protein
MTNKLERLDSVDRSIDELLDGLGSFDERFEQILEGVPIFTADGSTARTTLNEVASDFVTKVMPATGGRYSVPELLQHMGDLLGNEEALYNHELRDIPKDSEEKPNTYGFQFVNEFFQNGSLNTLYIKARGDKRVIADQISATRTLYVKHKQLEAVAKDEILLNSSDEDQRKAAEAAEAAETLQEDLDSHMFLCSDVVEHGTAGIDHLNRLKGHYAAADADYTARKTRKGRFWTAVKSVAVTTLGVGAIAALVGGNLLNSERAVSAALQLEADQAATYQSDADGLRKSVNGLESDVDRLGDANAALTSANTAYEAELASKDYGVMLAEATDKAGVEAVLDKYTTAHGGLVLAPNESVLLQNVVGDGTKLTVGQEGTVLGYFTELGIKYDPENNPGQQCVGWNVDQ